MALLTAGDEVPLDGLHDDSVVDFVNPMGFGYFKDRRHVAGFDAHRFVNVPRPAERWAIKTLELVGLLLLDEPRVYVSATLPRMDELRRAPTRPLDSFEAMGLKAVRGGDDLVIAREGDDVRMFGAVRSLRQCVACHGGTRGDLLGAFSYTLRHVDGPAADGEPSRGESPGH